MDYPEFIKNLPQADISLENVQGWLDQGTNIQIAFFDIETESLPLHNHCSQFGVVLEGEMTLTIGGESKLYKKGDTYFIPEGVEHGAVFHTRVKAIDFFADPNRYKSR